MFSNGIEFLKNAQTQKIKTLTNCETISISDLSNFSESNNRFYSPSRQRTLLARIDDLLIIAQNHKQDAIASWMLIGPTWWWKNRAEIHEWNIEQDSRNWRKSFFFTARQSAVPAIFTKYWELLSLHFMWKNKKYKEKVPWKCAKTAISGIFGRKKVFLKNRTQTRPCFGHCYYTFLNKRSVKTDDEISSKRQKTGFRAYFRHFRTEKYIDCKSGSVKF